MILNFQIVWYIIYKFLDLFIKMFEYLRDEKEKNIRIDRMREYLEKNQILINMLIIEI